MEEGTSTVAVAAANGDGDGDGDSGDGDGARRADDASSGGEGDDAGDLARLRLGLLRALAQMTRDLARATAVSPTPSSSSSSSSPDDAGGGERRALAIAATLAVFNQATCSTAVINYAPVIFRDAGVDDDADAVLLSSLVSLAKLAGAISLHWSPYDRVGVVNADP